MSGPVISALRTTVAVNDTGHDAIHNEERAAINALSTAVGNLPTQTDLRSTDANILYITASSAYPLRAAVTTDLGRRARWIGPVAPPATAGYALDTDVWERTA